MKQWHGGNARAVLLLPRRVQAQDWPNLYGLTDAARHVIARCCNLRCLNAILWRGEDYPSVPTILVPPHCHRCRVSRASLPTPTSIQLTPQRPRVHHDVEHTLVIAEVRALHLCGEALDIAAQVENYSKRIHEQFIHRTVV